MENSEDGSFVDLTELIKLNQENQDKKNCFHTIKMFLYNFFI
jgi:hypothetical protein